jgi:hypothetical protein
MVCKKKREPSRCQRRIHFEVDEKYQCDLIWMMWDILVQVVKEKTNVFLESIVCGLCTLFQGKYVTVVCKKRKYLLYFAVEMITQHVDETVELIGTKEKETLFAVIRNIDLIYLQIKKNESTKAVTEKDKHARDSMIKLNLMESVDMIARVKDNNA